MSPGPMRWQIRKRENTQPPSAPPPPTDEEQEADKAVSFSRDSAGKEQRLREWREQQDREEPIHHRNEHRRNYWTAHKHDLRIAASVSSIEPADDIGDRGYQLIDTARETDATVVIVPSLRRLGVGIAQVELRRRLEAAGLRVISEDERENTVLGCAPSPRRERDLWDFAGDAELEWAENRERLKRAHFDYWETENGRAVLAFVAERPHLSLKQLGKALEFRGLQTPTGKTDAWYPTTVSRVRKLVAERIGYHESRVGADSRDIGS